MRIIAGRFKRAALAAPPGLDVRPTADRVREALDGHGIVMRAEWDIARYLRSGRLVQVLPGYRTPEADIHAGADYRRMLVAELTLRALAEATREGDVEGAA